MTLAQTALSNHYRIVRSRRKTVAIHVKGEQVEVRAPHSVDTRWIAAFVDSKQLWINKQLLLQKQRAQETLTLAHQAPIYLLGQELKQHWLYNQTRSFIQQENDQLIIGLNTNHTNAAAQAHKLISQWLKQQASELMTPLTRELAKQLKLDYKLSDVRYRKTKSKWGHCTQNGVIQYNWLAIMAPRFVVDYLICHETCHLQFMNHSRQFWQLVDHCYPNSESAKQWLKQHGHRLWL